MENVNLTFWVKAISLAAHFGSTRSASTSIDHKQRIRKSNFQPPPPAHLKISPLIVFPTAKNFLSSKSFPLSTSLSIDKILTSGVARGGGAMGAAKSRIYLKVKSGKAKSIFRGEKNNREGLQKSRRWTKN